MANGKNTPMCLYCKHSCFVRTPADTWEAPMHCTLWEIIVPVNRYGSLNLFCSRFEPKTLEVGSLGVLLTHMKDAILYAIFYNDFGCPDKLMPVFDLHTKEFTDGRAKVIPPLIHNGVKYAAPHFKFARIPDEWAKYNQNGGFVEAWDVNSDKMLWDLVVYRINYDPRRPRYEQDVFITAMKLQGNCLIITNEHQAKYKIDLSTKTIKTVEE